MKYILLAIAMVITILASSALAAGPTDIWVDSPQPLHFQDPVNFGYSYNGPTSNGAGPWLQIRCYQQGNLVLSDVRAGFVGGYRYGWAFWLGPTMSWTGGPADCVGQIGHQTKRGFKLDASVEFPVDA